MLDVLRDAHDPSPVKAIADRPRSASTTSREGETHDIRVGAADLPDEEGAHPLDGVGARLVVGLLRGGVPGHLVGCDLPKEDRRLDDLADQNPLALPGDAEAREDFVLPAAQLFEHLPGLGRRSGFAQDLAVDDHDRIGAEDPGVRVKLSNGERLFLGEPQRVLPGGLPLAIALVDAARHHLESKPHELQKLNPAGRGRGQDELSRDRDSHAGVPL